MSRLSSKDAALKYGKYLGNAGVQYLNGYVVSAGGRGRGNPAPAPDPEPVIGLPAK
jgi:hypothetical protein